MIYIISFVLSDILFFLSGIQKMKRKKVIIVILGLFLVSALAGMRSENIGVDVKVYAIDLYQRAVESNSLFTLCSDLWSEGYKNFGFYILNFTLSRFSPDYHLGLFFYELITVGFMYMGVYECSKFMKTPIWLAMLFILLSLYNPSLNIMRQCIAVSILFYGIACLMNRKLIHYVIFQIIAFMFHTSAIFGVLIVSVYFLLRYKNNVLPRKQILNSFALVLLCLGCVLLIIPTVTFLVKIGMFDENFLTYLPGGHNSNLGNGDMINPLSVMPSLFYLCLVGIHYKKLMNEKGEGLYMLFCCLAVFLISFGPLVADFIERVGYYFIPFQCVALANVSNVCIPKYRNWYIILVITAMLVVWYVTVVLLGYYGTYPYEFFWNV